MGLATASGDRLHAEGDRGAERAGVGGEGVAGVGDLGDVGVEVALGADEGAVSGDLPQDVGGDSCVGEPGESGVAQVGAPQVFVAQGW
jgi:hypothetical protein